MATTIAPGNWHLDAATVWDTGIAPGDGEEAIINHNIVVDENTTIGTSPATNTYIVTIDQAATFDIAAGVKLTLRGDMWRKNNPAFPTNVTLAAGASIEIDESQAASPGTTNYKITLGSSSDYRSYLVCNGTSGSRCSISSNSGGANGYFDGPVLGSGLMQVDYTDFSDIGTATTPAIYSRGNSATDQWIRDCTFTDCGQVDIRGVTTTSTRIERNVWIGSTNTDTLYMSLGYYTSGTRSLIDNVFDTDIDIVAWDTLTIDGNYIHGVLGLSSTHEAELASCADNYMRVPPTNTITNPKIDLDDCLLHEADANINPHWLTMGGTAGTGTEAPTITGCIFQPDNDLLTGDIAMGTGTNGRRNITMKNNIVLPGPAGTGSAGAIVAFLGSSDSYAIVEHNTLSCMGINVGEAYNGFSGMVTSLKSNIVWRKTSGGTGFKAWNVGSGVQDIMPAANADYNCGHNIATGDGKGYDTNLTYSSGTPGTNDIDVDPQFVDDSRCIATYDTATSGLNNSAETAWVTSTSYVLEDDCSNSDSSFWDDATINFRCIQAHTSGATTEPGVGADWRDYWEYKTLVRFRDDTAVIATCVTWIKAGFVTNNALLENAGHDGATIGAMGYADGSAITTTVTATNATGSDQESFTWTEVSPP